MPDETFLKLVHGAIGIRGILKKSLARKLKISKPAFSEMLHGDREMPPEVEERLIKELGLEELWQRLSVPANTPHEKICEG